MVNIEFPAELTEEESMLQGKYQQLKKMKNAVRALKESKSEPETSIKRLVAAKYASEVAKKLIKTGLIAAISKQDKQPEQGFKRPKSLEKKLPSDKVASGYRSFSANQLDDDLENSENKPPTTNARDREKQQKQPEKPRRGNTISVSGYKITEEFLKKHFSTFGNIINVTMEMEKNRGFITFDKVEAAERAISEMDGSMVAEILLKVSLARMQPHKVQTNYAQSSPASTPLASRNSQNENRRGNRDLVVYDQVKLI